MQEISFVVISKYLKKKWLSPLGNCRGRLFRSKSEMFSAPRFRDFEKSSGWRGIILLLVWNLKLRAYWKHNPWKHYINYIIVDTKSIVEVQVLHVW